MEGSSLRRQILHWRVSISFVFRSRVSLRRWLMTSRDRSGVHAQGCSRRADSRARRVCGRLHCAKLSLEEVKNMNE